MRKALIRKLHEMQRWRRGADIPMPLTQKEFGIAIDDCIRVIRKLNDEQFNKLMNGSNRRECEIYL